MKVGDLVMFRNCEQEGQTGIITVRCKASEVALGNPALRLFWVVFEDGVRCFTGNQLRLV